jgi:hypothetical protein
MIEFGETSVDQLTSLSVAKFFKGLKVSVGSNTAFCNFKVGKIATIETSGN